MTVRAQTKGFLVLTSLLAAARYSAWRNQTELARFRPLASGSVDGAVTAVRDGAFPRAPRGSISSIGTPASPAGRWPGSRTFRKNPWS